MRPLTLSVVLVFSLAVFGMLLNFFIVSSSGQWFAKDFMIKKEKVVFCENVFSNLTAGTWIETIHETKKKEELDKILLDYRLEVGIPATLWRNDGKCGYKNTHRPERNTSWPDVGSWCNPDGDLPCCTDLQDGVCARPSSMSCKCADCVDTRAFVHSEISEWKVDDSKCKSKRFNTAEACDVIEKSVYKEIFFVGDSHIRNMYMTMLSFLSDTPEKGIWNRSMTRIGKEKCAPPQMLFWKVCRKLTKSSKDLFDVHALCRGYPRNFELYMWPYHSAKLANQFLTDVKSLLGKKGTLILLSVGYHIECSSEIAIEEFLKPVLELIYSFYKESYDASMWPRIMFIVPMRQSLLSPPEYFHLQNNKLLEDFAIDMRKFCQQYSIPVIDFKNLSKNVHSFDGIHYGYGVNLMKNQIFLNYLYNEL